MKHFDYLIALYLMEFVSSDVARFKGNTITSVHEPSPFFQEALTGFLL